MLLEITRFGVCVVFFWNTSAMITVSLSVRYTILHVESPSTIRIRDRDETGRHSLPASDDLDVSDPAPVHDTATVPRLR